MIPNIVPTSNILQRTFFVRQGQATGTAFTIDRNGRQYLVTARHVTDGSSGVIDLFHDGKWKRLEVSVVGAGKTADVVVLCAEMQVSPAHPLGVSEELFLGLPVMFLGFPFGWQHGDGGINRGFPFPFAKAGIVSMIEDGPLGRIWVDAHGNRGFSGGPLVVQKMNGDMGVVGIVVEAVQNPKGVETIDEHAGFVIAEPIRCAREIVESNPIGFPLSDVSRSEAASTSPEPDIDHSV